MTDESTNVANTDDAGGPPASNCSADLIYTLQSVQAFVSNAIQYASRGDTFMAGRVVEKASRLLDKLNVPNVTDERR